MKERLEAQFQKALAERNHQAAEARQFTKDNYTKQAEYATQLQVLEQGKMEAYAQVLWDEFGVRYPISSGEKM